MGPVKERARGGKSMTTEDRVRGYLGLAARARHLESGEFAAEKAVKSGKAYLLFIAGDASDNTKKKFRNMCGHYGVPCCIFGTRAELGHAIGREFRAIAAVTDRKLAEAIRALYPMGHTHLEED